MALVKKKLLILTDWFTPGYKAGGPIQSCVNICAALNNVYDIYVLTTDTDHGEEQPYAGIEANKWSLNTTLNSKVCYLEKRKLSKRSIAKEISFVNADIIYLNHLFSPLFVVYPLWLNYRNIIKCRVVVCPRGALYKSALSLKAYKKKPLLTIYKWLGVHKKIVFHATNEREQISIGKYFPGSKVIVADNLPNMTQTHFESIDKRIGVIRCIFIARIVPIKNLLFLLEVLMNVTRNVMLTVVGPIENESYWNSCEALIKKLPPNISVTAVGARPNSELRTLIQQHHLFVLPTTGENFGHSIFEAMLAGRPVLISDQTPWLHLQTKKAGWHLSLHNINGFKEVIEFVADCNQQQYDEYAHGAWQFAADYISKNEEKENYITLFG